MRASAESVGERPVVDLKTPRILIGMPDGKDHQELIRCITSATPCEIRSWSAFAELEARAARDMPNVIVFSESILRPETSLPEAAHRLTAFAPVIVLASSNRQSDLVGLVVSGEVDFVSVSGDSASVAAAFIERRLNSPDGYSREFRSAWTADVPSDFAEILRHEINNPLTGILGNAELLLSQLRGKLPPLSVQRLETVVDLAVRLREKVRRLAAEPRNRESKVRSA